MNAQLQEKLKDLPKQPGVYFHKDIKGEIIYVGKAAVLRNRVRQYFQKSRARDPKTEVLVAEIVDTDWMVVESELEALFLEAEMIRRYMPRYNILLRDDKSMSYIRIDIDSDYPTVTITRRPLDDGARYFGPYLSAYTVKRALRILRKIFPFAVKKNEGGSGERGRVTLYYHLGLDPGLEQGKTSLEEYRACLRKLISVIEGKRTKILKELEREMKVHAKEQNYEMAAKVRNQLFLLQNLGKQVIFSDKEFMDISKDHALTELVNLLSMPKYPYRIEGYDISHMQGTDVVASMVVFTNGVSNKGEYRKFKTKKDHNNDFYNMHETISRRFSEKNIKAWGKPDLVLIDGGKGQLDAAIRARDERGFSNVPFIGLAKREEQIVIKKSHVPVATMANALGDAVSTPGYVVDGTVAAGSGSDAAAVGMVNETTEAYKSKDGQVIKGDPEGSNVSLDASALQSLGGFVSESDDFILTNVPHNTNLVKLLQRIRDESHRFAVSYHSVLKRKRQTASTLDEIPTIGPATRKKLLKTFGSMRGVMQARDFELEKTIGEKKTAILKQYLRPLKKEAKEIADGDTVQ